MSRNDPVSQLAQSLSSSVIVDTPYQNERIIGTMKVDQSMLTEPFSMQTIMTRPNRIGYYSRKFNSDGSLTYRADASLCRYLDCPLDGKVNIDLLEGFSSRTQWGRSSSGGKHILTWFAKNNQSADFVCDSRVLRSIMESPYNNDVDWTCIAVKIDGMIFLEEFDTPRRERNKENQNIYENKSSYAGFKFERQITRLPNGSRSSFNHEGKRDSFHVVCKTKVGHHQLLYSSRPDCVFDKASLSGSLQNMQLVKVATKFNAKNMTKFYRNTTLKWWTQSKLCDNNIVMCGIKERNFRVEKVVKYQVDNLVQPSNGWSPKTCVDFLDSTLTYIKSKVNKEYTPYRFYCADGKIIFCQLVNQPVENFIPSWYQREKVSHRVGGSSKE